MYSKSLLTGKEYLMPQGSDDRTNIESFLKRNQGKPVIAVQGLGFVGSVMALVCANAHGANYSVIGVDRLSPESFWRIASLNEGTFPLIAEDPKIIEFFGRARAKGNFLATYDPLAYEKADIIIVDVNLDVGKEVGERGDLRGFDVSLNGFRAAIRSIGERCREDALVIVETTVPPGTCQKVVWPVLEECMRSRGMATSRLRVAHSYERVMPGPEYVDSIMNYPRVYSGLDKASADAAEGFLKTIIDTGKCRLTRLDSTNATEMAKVLENSYRAMNIAFIVEWSRFAEEAGVNLYDVVRAIRARPTHANIMFPGIGVGGYCLTKDPLLASWARSNLFHAGEGLALSEKSVAVNDKMPDFAFRYLSKAYGPVKGKRVLLLGVSYRGDVGDTRSTPVELFYDCLAEAGAKVSVHDPYVGYWQEKDMRVEGDLSRAFSFDPEIVVISAGHRIYTDDSTIAMLLERGRMVIFDTIGALSAKQIGVLGSKHIIKVLGRGDL